MVIIGIDSSGIIGSPPVYMVAVRKRRVKDIQKHVIIQLNQSEQDKYQAMLSDDWKLKLSAALMFKAMETLLKEEDSIQIDTDWQGKNKEIMKGYLKRLCGIHFQGTIKENPDIQFIPATISEFVNEAHKKTQAAKRKKIVMIKCPSLNKCLEYLQ